ncbi:MAG: DEAD/DEAH box helicase [Fervidobacterium pennivorans]|uniref:DEAD/DEAH box helicase n=1 Tax=Fervidobacterium islandicum TaxID=2423 RepID=A0AAI8CL52_FERIS|nr:MULTISPECIES: DEAD/DEAH box helicase [Fervidobacterium]AMW32391.2 DEAD/DEAH box helicase [Fervidobacterium islandicum]SDH37698.1 Superfamily II DNA or RNA helicase [Fervidobacterium changbaicum]
MGNITLHQHQIEAIDAWFANNCRGIISMATGTGKTFTAIGALERLIQDQQKHVIFISAPYAHLVNQWQSSIKKYGLHVDVVLECHSKAAKWHEKAENALRKLRIGIFKRLIFLSTHNTLVGEKVNQLISSLPSNSEINLTIVADEVHGIGSEMRRENLSDAFNYRLGLSATPKRMYDEIGNRFLRYFFGDVIYEFSLCKAVNNINPDTQRTYLTPYYYYPIPCYLTDDEMRKYRILTEKIVKRVRNLDNITYADLEDDPEIRKLLFQRSKILKTSSSKYSALKYILNEIKSNGNVERTIVFCDEKLIDRVMEILQDEGVIAQKFVQELSYAERKHILKLFESGLIEVLVGIKMLDEGVDVPGVDKAIILSSSTNPREYIQRLGRVLRISPAKDYAYVYDVIVLPKLTGFEDNRVYKRILEVEFSRVEIMAQCAENLYEAIQVVNNIERGYIV